MTLDLVQGRSLAAMPDQGGKTEEPATAASCEKRPVQKNLSGHQHRRRRKRDSAAAATRRCRSRGDIEEGGSCGNLTVGVDDDLSDVSEIQELTAEEGLLRAVGLDESK